MLKRLIAIAALGLGSSALMSVEAQARWVCRAYSPTGSYGWGAHNTSQGYARERALAECAIRTPRGYVCRLRSCFFN